MATGQHGWESMKTLKREDIGGMENERRGRFPHWPQPQVPHKVWSGPDLYSITHAQPKPFDEQLPKYMY